MGDTASLTDRETVITKKRSSLFPPKKIGATPSVVASGDTNPSDATAKMYDMCERKGQKPPPLHAHAKV